MTKLSREEIQVIGWTSLRLGSLQAELMDVALHSDRITEIRKREWRETLQAVSEKIGRLE